MADTYVVKVSSVGQVTLPKEMRKELGLTKDDYILIEKIGGTFFLKKLEADRDILEMIRRRVRKSCITRERLDEIIEEESQDVWEKYQSLS
jgi:AbrB family looped-hinge helix DNA binding protein